MFRSPFRPLAFQFISAIIDKDKTVSFTYDSKGQRLTKNVYKLEKNPNYDPDSENPEYQLLYILTPIKKSTFVNGFYDFTAATGPEAGNIHISDGTGIIATKLNNNHATTLYYTANNIGSTSLLTNAAGSPVQTYHYYPFGETWLKTGDETDITRLFTGQEFDTETGLYYMNNRYYDPALGSFITSDPVLSGLNHYGYTSGNPIMYTDPTGLLNQDPIFGFGFGFGGETAAQQPWDTAGNGGQVLSFVGVMMDPIGHAIDDAESKGYVTAAQASKMRTAKTVVELAAIVKALGVTAIRGGKWILGRILRSAIKNGSDDLAEATLRASDDLLEAATGKCFTAGTLILTEDGHKPIEELQPSDSVLSWNEQTGETELQPVINNFKRESNELTIITIGDKVIETTEEHPFWVVNQGWTKAGKLNVGAQLLLENGKKVEVTAFEQKLLERPVTVYNLEVAETHTYFVSSLNALVLRAKL